MKNILSLLVLISTLSYAQETAEIHINNIRLPINNRGILADVNYGNLGHGGRYGEEMKYFLFSGGFYLSGYSDTTLWANAVSSAGLIEDYQPGVIGTDPDYEMNVIYSVNASDPPFGEAWQNWQYAVEQGAYFYDGDGDGIYDPVDKNNNGQWDSDEDKPDIIYDVNYFTVYNDGVPSSERRFNEIEPVGIEIRQTAFASNRNTILDDVIFIRYSILYKGLGDLYEPDTLSDVVFSIWNDADIGGTATAASDDIVGCDTNLHAGFTYNDGDDEDWGVNPPAIFKAIVQGPLVYTGNPDDVGYNRMGPVLGEETYLGYKNSGMGSFVHFVSGDAFLNDPNNATFARSFMLGKIGKTDEYPDPCDWVYGEVRNMNCLDVNKKFWYSGDPVTDNGWICTAVDDQRDLTNTEQFTLVKDEPMDIIVAYVVGRGTNALNSITVAREITQYVHEENQRNFSTVVGVKDQKEEVVNSFSLSQNYPNPFNPTTTIKFSIPSNVKSETSNTKLVVYDILGRKVKTLVNEIKSPGSYEVKFDASQFASGVYFYRLESGSFIQTKKMMMIK